MIKIEIKPSVRCSCDYSRFLTFPYNTDIVAILRELPTRYWLPDTKEWEVPASKLEYLYNVFKDYEIETTGEEKLHQKVDVSLPTTFQFKTKPFTHQIDGIKYGLSHDRWLLGDEQGLGKTKQVIDIAVAKKIEKNYKHCLIICGVNGLKWNWLNEIQTHSNETGHILGQKIKKDKIVIGSTKDKVNDLDNIDLIDDYFLITNVESLRDVTFVTKLANLCKSDIIPMVAVDEIHRMRNPSSQQGKGLLKIQPKCRIAMSGTPLMNTPIDLFIILKWLGYERYTAYNFRNHYCIMGGYGGYEIVGYRYLDELQERLDSIMLRRLKSEVLDLPEKLYISEYVDMTPKQAKIYNEVRDEIRENIDKIKLSHNPLTEFMRMRQATGYTGILSSTVNEGAKLDRLQELVEDAINNDKKVVVFSNWTQMTSVISQRLSIYQPAIITGQISDDERQAEVDSFQNDPNTKVIIGTIGAMGTGLTLTAGTVIIFIDHPWTRAAYDQAVDRCHRIGQKSTLTIYNLFCKDTIDERVWNIMSAKGDMSDMLIDGKPITNKSDLVDYLIG